MERTVPAQDLPFLVSILLTGYPNEDGELSRAGRESRPEHPFAQRGVERGGKEFSIPAYEGHIWPREAAAGKIGAAESKGLKVPWIGGIVQFRSKPG